MTGDPLPGRLRDLVYALRRARLRVERRRLEYDREERDRADRLATVLDTPADDLRAYEREYDDLDWFHDAFAARFADLDGTPALTDTTHWRDGKTLYVVCRALEPEVVVETGVRMGSFDGHILAALHENGRGELHGLDLPGGPGGPFDYGHLVPDRCRDRWHLHTGDATDVLPDLLARLAPVDLFLHDSDHRRPHMAFEFDAALAHLAGDGVLAAHDVRLSGLFEQVCENEGLRSCVVCDTGVARR